MTTRIYGFTALTGGGTGALDKYPEAGMPALATDDYAFGHVAGVFYIYWFNGASAEAESPPAIIAPASGSGRWILKGFSFAHNDLTSIDGGNVSPEEYYHLSSADYNTINTALAQSILANPTGGAAPITNLTVAEQTLVGRITGGNVDDLSVAQVKTLLGVVSDEAYSTSWDAVTDAAPSKNAVYDKVQSILTTFPPPLTITSTTALESAPLGDELLSSSGWTSTDWTGDWAGGFDHNTGNTTALLNSLAAVSTNYYQITFTVTGRTAGNFTIAFGGVTSAAYSATGTWGPKATSTGSLSITPTSTFDGTIVISIKQITGAYAPVYKILNSAAGLALEIRSTTNNLYNTFIGIGVGQYNTTGYRNTALGGQTLYSNTTGYYNTALGFQALYSNTTGSYNTALGFQALYYNTTGYRNTALGSQALYYNTTGYHNIALGGQTLYSNTTGSYNIALGHNALYSNTTGTRNTAVGDTSGRFTAAATNNETSTNSVYLGYDTRSSASGNTNEIVMGYSAVGNGSNTVTIGNTSTTAWYMGATKLIGVQGAAVADATGAGDVVAQLNTLLARLRAHGLIAT